MRRARMLVGWCLILAFGAPLVVAQAPPSDWADVDYSRIVDRRALTHSGEPVGTLLARLEGRTVPAPGERPGDRLTHALLDPLLEPYAFVLSDALDVLRPLPGAPMVEIGTLWRPGGSEPAWVELLRARRYLVESDGRGRFRAFVPWDRTGPRPPATRAAEEAWADAWSVLRHVVAAERNRLATGREGPPPPIEVEIHAYIHRPERSRFELGLDAASATVDDSRPRGDRPPLDLGGIARFLASGLQLEGGRLDATGKLRLLGGEPTAPVRLLGRPLSLTDLAVAHRATAHGGLAEPYMSLDRGYSPHGSIVNYGGRLRDTALGLVSLLCDVRFKTFSLGLDIRSGEDVRDKVRESLPEFRTHLERLAEHPASAGFAGQQTRLWFYPDDVDLTLSRQGDVLVLRHVRMSAASERVLDASLTAAEGEDPPWTRATVAATNRDYDRLGQFFPELNDLDQVVRLLSLFTWLDGVAEAGGPVPDLDALLALELPAEPTPRTFPQLLAFNALPAPGSVAPLAVFDRVSVGTALDRLDPTVGLPLPARRRYARGVTALDARDEQDAALLAELAAVDISAVDEGTLDLLTYRAERLRMHRLVLGTLGQQARQELASRQASGEALRVFSVGIGGLDLGMRGALSRAASADPAAAGESERAVAASRPPREAWRVDPVGLPAFALPDHGVGDGPPAPGRRGDTERWIEVGVDAEGGERWIWTASGVDGPEIRSRRVVFDDSGRIRRFERVEGRWRASYRLESAGSTLKATPVPWGGVGRAAPEVVEASKPGLALVAVGGEATDPNSDERPAVVLRLSIPGPGGEARTLAADFPRNVLQRLVLGREVDLARGQPLGGLSPLPPALAAMRAVMVLAGPEAVARPWEPDGYRPVPGEEDPERLARALGDWWASEDGPKAVVGVDAETSPARWAAAPAVDGTALLVLPPDAFPGALAPLAPELASAWSPERVLVGLPPKIDASLVVLVSAEAPDLFAARLRQLAAAPALRGRLLAAWSLGGPVRPDVPLSILRESGLAGLAVADGSLVETRRARARLEALAQELARGVERPERLGGPFVWYF